MEPGEALVALFLSGALFASGFSVAVGAVCYAAWELAWYPWQRSV